MIGKLESSEDAPFRLMRVLHRLNPLSCNVSVTKSISNSAFFICSLVFFKYFWIGQYGNECPKVCQAIYDELNYTALMMGPKSFGLVILL